MPYKVVEDDKGQGSGLGTVEEPPGAVEGAQVVEQPPAPARRPGDDRRGEVNQVGPLLAVREDAHVLYGFMTAAERDLFRLLIHTVSGIGPKIAESVAAFLGAGTSTVTSSGAERAEGPSAKTARATGR